MFIIVTEVVDENTNLDGIISLLDRDNILWFDIPASSDDVKNGKFIARYITEDQFKDEFIIDSQETLNRYLKENIEVYEWLEGNYGSVVKPN